jgi:TetR/AcrR family transcriptional repressor of nem operon
MLHEQGVEKTTIADIAAAADVPVGNVYYYFKSKDELVSAVLDSHTHDLRAMLASLGRHRTPQARLKALIRALAEQREIVAVHGCPHGSLCSELDKRDDHERIAAPLVQIPIDWATQQFRQMGRRDARDLGIALIAAYHGAALLTNTLREPKVLAREARRLERWIDELA